MNNRSRSTLFLIEQLIVIAVFAICASACVKILTDAYFTANKTRDMSNALLAADSSAECFKSVSGDLEKVARLVGGTAGNADGAGIVVVYYDKDWTVCGEDAACYKLSLISGKPGEDAGNLSSGELSVVKLTGEELVSFTVLARR